jgi:hypothetical protein
VKMMSACPLLNSFFFFQYINWDLLVRKERLQLEKSSRAQKPVAPLSEF